MFWKKLKHRLGIRLLRISISLIRSSGFFSENDKQALRCHGANRLTSITAWYDNGDLSMHYPMSVALLGQGLDFSLYEQQITAAYE